MEVACSSPDTIAGESNQSDSVSWTFDPSYTLVGTLDEAIIGRKFDDDRGTNPFGSPAERLDDADGRSL